MALGRRAGVRAAYSVVRLAVDAVEAARRGAPGARLREVEAWLASGRPVSPPDASLVAENPGAAAHQLALATTLTELGAAPPPPRFPWTRWRSFGPSPTAAACLAGAVARVWTYLTNEARQRHGGRSLPSVRRTLRALRPRPPARWRRRLSAVEARTDLRTWAGFLGGAPWKVGLQVALDLCELVLDDWSQGRAQLARAVALARDHLHRRDRRSRRRVQEGLEELWQLMDATPSSFTRSLTTRAPETVATTLELAAGEGPRVPLLRRALLTANPPVRLVRVRLLHAMGRQLLPESLWPHLVLTPDPAAERGEPDLLEPGALQD